MGSTGVWVFIAMAIGTTFAGCSDYKGQEHIFQKDFRFLGDHDFEKPQSSTSINCKNNKRASQYNTMHNKGPVAENKSSYATRSYKDQETLMSRPYKNTKGNQAEMNIDRGYRRIQLLQRPGLLQKQASETYPQSFDLNQEPLWFQNPKVSVEHVYDLSPKKTVEEEPSQEGNWYQSLRKLLRLVDQMHSDDDCRKHQEISTKLQGLAEAKSKRLDGSEKEKFPKGSYNVEEILDGEEGPQEPKKIMEYTKPTNMEVVVNSGVPEPLVVKVPVPHSNEAHPNARESVPVPVALTIYKLVPEVMEKKIPMRVDRLVSMYKSNDAAMEESKLIEFRLNPPQ